ncbi:MAG TPA: ABC transporter substrate-binding protein [Stellaceae bacterium]|nr:ABC transporter substrate-binding protein [Stellaceae bacterium]
MTSLARALRGFAIALVSLLPAIGMAQAAPSTATLRVGKAFAGVFDFTPLDVGMKEGFFKQHGLDIEEYNFAGSAKLQQALAADAIDIGLGSGPELAFVARGAPVKGVAAFMGPPDGLVILVGAHSGIDAPADLKGKLISVSTVGSLTQWLVRDLSREEGWGPNGVRLAYLGASPAQVSAMIAGNTDGMVSDVVKATILEQKGVGRILISLGKVAPDFITHVVYARKALIAGHPNEVKEFLAGWFETVEWMRTHKAETVKIAAANMHEPPAIVAKAYDVTMPALSNTGVFRPKALAVLRRSFVEMGLLKTAPTMDTLYTQRFLPSPSAHVATASTAGR